MYRQPIWSLWTDNFTPGQNMEWLFGCLQVSDCCGELVSFSQHTCIRLRRPSAAVRLSICPKASLLRAPCTPTPLEFRPRCGAPWLPAIVGQVDGLSSASTPSPEASLSEDTTLELSSELVLLTGEERLLPSGLALPCWLTPDSTPLVLL